MVYRPRHQPQLGRGVPVPGRTRGSRDCGPRSIQMGMDKQTRGRLLPGPVELRKRMGSEGPVPTNVWDAKQGVESYKGGTKYRPMRYYIKRKVSDVKAAVRDGKPVQCAIDYGRFNDLMNKTGDPYFRGGHSVMVVEQKRWADGTIVWLLYDPLDDQRRSTIPQGPRWVPRSKVVAAMVALAGGNSNGIWAGVIGGGQKRV